jgi:hypothetical protein
MMGGVFIRTGSVIAASGVRVVSGLVQRLGSLSFIADKIDNLNDMLLEFCLIRSIDISRVLYSSIISLLSFLREALIFFPPFLNFLSLCCLQVYHLEVDHGCTRGYKTARNILAWACATSRRTLVVFGP